MWSQVLGLVDSRRVPVLQAEVASNYVAHRCDEGFSPFERWAALLNWGCNSASWNVRMCGVFFLSVIFPACPHFHLSVCEPGTGKYKDFSHWHNYVDFKYISHGKCGPLSPCEFGPLSLQMGSSYPANEVSPCKYGPLSLQMRSFPVNMALIPCGRCRKWMDNDSFWNHRSYLVLF